MKQRRTQGSILGFVLVGALLTALVVGGVLVAKRYISGQQASPTTTEVSDKPAAAPSDKKDTSSTNGKNSTDLKQALEQQSAAEKKAQEQKAAAEAENNTPRSTTSTSSTSATNSLPATGPADTLVSLTGAMMLVGAGVAYSRSRSLN
jgi:outer membrane biosynthesis protein TonB